MRIKRSVHVYSDNAGTEELAVILAEGMMERSHCKDKEL